MRPQEAFLLLGRARGVRGGGVEALPLLMIQRDGYFFERIPNSRNRGGA
jgi:hypothetical protein